MKFKIKVTLATFVFHEATKNINLKNHRAQPLAVKETTFIVSSYPINTMHK